MLVAAPSFSGEKERQQGTWQRLLGLLPLAPWGLGALHGHWRLEP